MRILVDPSSYDYRNAGDLAMLLVAADRIGKVCPGASLRVITLDPGSLARLLPQAVPVPAESRFEWYSRSMVGGHSKRLPIWLRGPLKTLEDRLWAARPDLCSRAIRLRLPRKSQPRTDPCAFVDEIRSSDLVLVSGMGALNDPFRAHALALLDVMALAHRRGIPVALFGQGIGPITDRELFRRAREVLPRVRFIGLREGRTAVPLLASLGVSPSRMEVTGDDALELVYVRRPAALGSAIGVNIRLALYAGTGQEALVPVRAALERVAPDLGAPLIPLPISSHEADSGVRSLRELASGMSARWIGEFQLDDPPGLQVIPQTGRCRVVVTGSYHAAVFALGQGIPAVCMEHSPYYSQKFRGLQAQFGAGVETVPMAEPDFGLRLERAIRFAWDSAERLRVSLLDATAAQIDLSRAAYARFFSGLGKGGTGTP